MKVVNSIREMDSNDAIFFLTDGAAVLALHAGRFVSFLDEGCFVDDTDGVFAGVFFGDDFLEFVSHFMVIPFLFCEKPLYGSDGHVGLEGDGFAVFAWEVGEESVGVDSEIVPGILVGKAGLESLEEAFQVGANVGGNSRVHSSIVREGNVLVWKHFTAF